MSTPSKHLVGFPFQAWGHARPLANLATRLVKLDPQLCMTLLVTNSFFDQTLMEIACNFGPNEHLYAQRIRVVSLGEAHFTRAQELDVAFEATWKKLILEEELVCAKTNTRHNALAKPQAIILDFFSVKPFEAIKRLSKDSVKVHVWCSGLTAALYHWFGPERLGGKGNVRIKAEEESRRTGTPATDIILRELAKPTGEVVRIPGIPPMYDYEYYPQPSRLPPQVVIGIFSHIHELLEDCDSMLLYTAESYEPDAVAAAREWFAETSRKIYVCGPLVPLRVPDEDSQAKNMAETQAFMSSTLVASGQQSLLYISFGTLNHGTSEVQKLRTLLDVVTELDISFIMSYATESPEEIIEKLKSYPKGLVVSWAPQQIILDHPATGWFLTHGGHNSTLEAVAAGVPLIFWPFAADQPLSAVHVTENLHAGYELFETRCGAEGLKPIFRTGHSPTGTALAFDSELRSVLQKAFSEDGARKRENLRKVSEAVRREWDEGGTSMRDITEFVNAL
ncbi:UDP-Glycosyltransferase/glycogen phosphorylase [Trametes meyenii]|nr:UDP-Glycosyltransferase/glycogen phosphorylase [Trametes meyenii]